jgi:hypothetical protein
LTINENCIFSQNSARFESHIHEVGLYTKRVFDGYVAKVLTQPPPLGEFWMYDFSQGEWDPVANPNPQHVVLVLVPGTSSFSGKRYKKCNTVDNFDFAILRIKNFNSSSPACVDELKAIQSMQKRVIATFCGRVKRHPTGYRYLQMNNDNRPYPMIFSYNINESGNLLADYTTRTIIRAREHRIDKDTGECNLGESKCKGWNQGTIPFEFFNFQTTIFPFHLTSCIGDSDIFLCSTMAQPEFGVEMLPDPFEVNPCCYFYDNLTPAF